VGEVRTNEPESTCEDWPSVAIAVMCSTPQCLMCHLRSVMLWMRQQQEKGNPMSFISDAILRGVTGAFVTNAGVGKIGMPAEYSAGVQ